MSNIAYALEELAIEKRLEELNILKPLAGSFVKLLAGKYKGRVARVTVAFIMSERNRLRLWVSVEIPTIRNPKVCLWNHPDARRAYRLSEVEFIGDSIG